MLEDRAVLSREMDASAVPTRLLQAMRWLLRDPDLDPSPGTRLEYLNGWDSLSQISLMVETEYRYDVVFEVAEIESVQTVGDIVDLIRTKASTQAL